MKTIFSHILFTITCIGMIACQNKETNAMSCTNNQSTSENKTLIVYYSYTNNTEEIVTDLKNLIDADIIEIEPADKNLNYEANNYRIGTEQLNKIKNNPNDENSYPAIDPIEIDLSKYNTIIIATPLWWSQMASNMQTFLFEYGKEMAGKNIGLIVSSHSSGISGVEADAKRLIPEGNFFSQSLWINNSRHSQRKELLKQWLEDVDYASLQTETVSTMYITVNNHNMIVDLENNSSTKALVALLQESAITYEAHDYGDFEKVGEFGYTLPQNNEQITTEPGDLILYQGNQICIYYGVNSWNFTRLGKIRDTDSNKLKNMLGNGNIQVTLSLEQPNAINNLYVPHSINTGTYNITGQQLNQAPAQGIYIENGIKKYKK
ncbi:MAG: hypothetical protein MJ197_09345 [Bacteroidales bacterium]|nr:hypothetical protein [Bacteroidales bacterium]